MRARGETRAFYYMKILVSARLVCNQIPLRLKERSYNRKIVFLNKLARQKFWVRNFSKYRWFDMFNFKTITRADIRKLLTYENGWRYVNIVEERRELSQLSQRLILLRAAAEDLAAKNATTVVEIDENEYDLIFRKCKVTKRLV